MNIFNSAPSGKSSYDGDGNCTCGCEGKPPCEDNEQEAFVNAPSLVVGAKAAEQVVKTGLGGLFAGIATFVTAMLTPHETGINASFWSDRHQQKLDELSYKESQGTLTNQEKRDLQELRERYFDYIRIGTYENPGHHDPNGGGPNHYNPNKSVLPEDHYELWLRSVDGGDGNRYTKVGSGKKAVYHRFQNDGNGNWHWNGSTNGKTKSGKPYPLRLNTIPNSIQKL